MCFDFNPDQDYLFVVGTEEGQLFKCSTAYSSEYLQVGCCWVHAIFILPVNLPVATTYHAAMCMEALAAGAASLVCAHLMSAG